MIFTHSPEFTAVAATDAAHAAMLQTAKALAMTGIDVALDPTSSTRIGRLCRASQRAGTTSE